MRELDMIFKEGSSKIKDVNEQKLIERNSQQMKEINDKKQKNETVILKQRTVCERWKQHGSLEAKWVCVELNCPKQAICDKCLTEHRNHTIESIQNIQEKVHKTIEKHSKLHPHRDIVALEQLESSITEKFINMQVSLNKALRNFSEKMFLYKQTIKRQQLDTLYQLEYSCQHLQNGQYVDLQSFNKHLQLLNSSLQFDDAGFDLTKPADNFQEVQRIDIVREDLLHLLDNLEKCQGHFTKTFEKQTKRINRIFGEAVEDDEQADYKLKIFSGRESSAKESRISNSLSFDLIDLVDIPSEEDDGNDFGLVKTHKSARNLNSHKENQKSILIENQKSPLSENQKEIIQIVKLRSFDGLAISKSNQNENEKTNKSKQYDNINNIQQSTKNNKKEMESFTLVNKEIHHKIKDKEVEDIFTSMQEIQ